MTTLENKVVLITGASSGFGEDAALLFAKEGCKVVLAARRLDRLQNLAAKIQELGGEAIAVPVDIVDPAEVDNMVQTTIDLYGHIDILLTTPALAAWIGLRIIPLNVISIRWYRLISLP
ncbi:MAG: SDR family NAD(P)-dependent oxidoreductase [Anaerolineales bacterium]|nr:SDR family NAD(P)-dependent oxidoreductase [Anaerolineales bacterium]